MIRPVRPDGTIDTGGVFAPILRPRVLERIGSAAMQRVVLLVAPAGYGKSVALRQYLQQSAVPHISYDVRLENAGLLGFLRGLADALEKVAPQARATLAGAYERNAGSASPGADLALWMDSHLKAFRGVIAIDDLHFAQEEREVTRCLAALIERTKGRVQWIIASRSTLGLPIGTWLAYGESDLAVDEHDLRFSVEEARDAARSFRLSVREEELHELLALTGGWATAMSFALRNSTRSVDLRSIAASTREMIYRYLAEQVYRALGDEERNLLESAALLDHIDLDVLVAAGFNTALALIENLLQRVAFIHDEGEGRYTCHDLFREFIIHQLALRGAESVAAEQIRLGRVLEGISRAPSALRLFSGAGATPEIESLLQRSGFELLEKGHADVVSAALDVLERGTISPLTLALRGLVEINAGRYADGERRVVRAIESIADPQIEAVLRLRLAILYINRKQDIGPLLDPVIEERRSPHAAQLEAHAILAVDRVRSGAIEKARDHMREVESWLNRIDNGELLAKLLQRLGLARFELNDPAAAKQLFLRAADVAVEHGLWSVNARSHSALSNFALMSDNDIAASERYAQKAAFAAAKAGDHFDLQTALLQLLTIETKRGNAERAVAIERELGQLPSGDRTQGVFLAASQGHRAAWSGKMGEARRLFGSIVQRQPHVFDRAVTQSIYALCLALDDLRADARTASAEVLSIVDDANPALDCVGALYFEAALLFCALVDIVCERHTAAAKILKRPAICSDEVVAQMRACVEEVLRVSRSPQYSAPGFETQLEAIRTFGLGGYGRFILMAATAVETRHSSGGTDVKLTPSEARILRDLAQGLTPKEIASEMGRSVFTVQTHIQNVIDKLGCHGRVEAIAAARRMGFL
ncbi:MAG: helix-turn-helix transcriptional regulator [Vulcanimicrobiaceae bacterium]